MLEKDGQLIGEFNDSRNEQAFAALVQRHVNLVFATALRQVGDHGIAEEVTQNVFIALAQSAGKLGRHPTIAGWLYQTTLNKSRERLRSELRRQRREQIAVNLEKVSSEGDSVWASVVPLLDEALLELREADRLAVIMHFMEGQTFGEVGATLGVGEDAARKRVHRCLDQLTGFFRRRGFAVPVLAVGTPLFVMSSQAAPIGLSTSVVTAGLAASHMAASGSTLTLIKGALKIMAWTKAKTVIVAGAVVILAAGTTTVIVKNSGQHRPPENRGKLLLLAGTNGNIMKLQETPEPFQRESIIRMNQGKNWALAFLLFANDHRSQFPKDFDQVKTGRYIRDLPDSNWEVVSSGNLTSFAKPAETVLLREKESRQSPDGNFIKAYVFTDGHVEMVSSPDGDFAAVEKQRGFLLRPAK